MAQKTLRQLREEAGLTQEQVARLTPLHQTHVSALERGNIPTPSIKTMRALAGAYNLPIEAIDAALRASVITGV